jgi:hypothetical protein
MASSLAEEFVSPAEKTMQTHRKSRAANDLFLHQCGEQEAPGVLRSSRTSRVRSELGENGARGGSGTYLESSIPRRNSSLGFRRSCAIGGEERGGERTQRRRGGPGESWATRGGVGGEECQRARVYVAQVRVGAVQDSCGWSGTPG